MVRDRDGQTEPQNKRVLSPGDKTRKAGDTGYYYSEKAEKAVSGMQKMSYLLICMMEAWVFAYKSYCFLCLIYKNSQQKNFKVAIIL